MRRAEAWDDNVRGEVSALGRDALQVHLPHLFCQPSFTFLNCSSRDGTLACRVGRAPSMCDTTSTWPPGAGPLDRTAPPHPRSRTSLPSTRCRPTHPSHGAPTFITSDPDIRQPLLVVRSATFLSTTQPATEANAAYPRQSHTGTPRPPRSGPNRLSGEALRTR